MTSKKKALHVTLAATFLGNIFSKIKACWVSYLLRFSQILLGFSEILPGFS